MGEAPRRDRDRHGRVRRRRSRSPRRMASTTSSTTATAISSPRSGRSPAAGMCDVVYDSVGKDTFPGSLDCLKPLGMFVSFGQSSGPIPPFSISHPGAEGLALRDAADAVRLHRQARRPRSLGRGAVRRGGERESSRSRSTSATRWRMPPRRMPISKAAGPPARRCSFPEECFGFFENLEALSRSSRFAHAAAHAYDAVGNIEHIWKTDGRRCECTTRGPTAANLLEVRGLTKIFGTLKACDHVDLTIGKGEIHALLGENGAGKSTLVKMLFGSLEPNSGEILWKGEPVRIASPSAARKLGIGMVFQHFSLFEALTAAENIALSLDDDTPISTIAAKAQALSYSLRPAARSLFAGRRPVGRRAPAHRDHPLPAADAAAHHPRRADLGADAAGGRQAVRDAGAAARARASRSSTSRTASKR